ncbi:MAG: Holliday junction resolvase RuvX [Bacteroidetes bacterium QS_7_67_15]|nr:MAG: Holliday junction resolvase RuvX [Bacteroidetes bacterium QS_7_67_15]
MTNRGRVVAIDYGTQRAGLAVADPLRMFAQPAGAVPPDEVIGRLEEIAAEADEGLDVLVVGWPLLPSGEEGEATARVANFIETLEAAFPEARVVRRDERRTSEMAKDAIREHGERRSGEPLFEKGRVDAAAAALILQDWLDGAGGRGGKGER